MMYLCTGICNGLICLFFADGVGYSVIACISQVESDKKRPMKTVVENAGLDEFLTEGCNDSVISASLPYGGVQYERSLYGKIEPVCSRLFTIISTDFGSGCLR
jgi:hypothetical protein